MSTEKNKTTKDKPPSEILLTRLGHIKDVHKVVSILFRDDADDPVLTRSQTWLRPTHATPLGKSASSASSSTSSSSTSHEENDRVRIALNAKATAIALSRLNVLVVCSVCNSDADEKGGDENDTRQHQGVIEIQATKKNKTKNKDIRDGGICVRSLAFVDFAHDKNAFLLVGLSSGRLEGYDCADVCSPRLLFSRKVSRAPLVSIRARPYGQRLGPKKESDDDGESAVLEEEEEEDVTIFAENGDVLRIDAMEMKSHLYRLRMARKQYAQDFQPEKDDYNTLTGMVKFDGFKRIAPIRDGVCVGNVPLTCSEVGLRERSKSRLNTLFNTSDDSDSDDDEKDENKFGFVACGKFGTIAFVQASGGSKFGAVEAVSMAAKKVFSFFAKKTKDIQKKRFDIVADGDDGDDDENESEEESENKTALKPSKWKSAIVDGPRKINTILNSPDGSFLATTDLLGRVSTYDCKYGNLSMRSMLKGCRDSDVGFINQRDLVVLSPHRGGGVIEYFPARLAFTKAVQMEKELVVGRDSRILSSARAFGTLFDKAEPEELYNTNSYLLGPDGNIDRISTLVS